VKNRISFKANLVSSAKFRHKRKGWVRALSCTHPYSLNMQNLAWESRYIREKFGEVWKKFLWKKSF